MKLVLCGDFVPTAATVPAFEAQDVGMLMGDTVDVVKSGDFAIANLECALTDTEGKTRKCGPNLKGKYCYSKVYKACGFTHLGLSNNHTMDFGIAGFRDTVKSVAEQGMIPFGYGENDQDSRKPLYIEKDGLKVAIIAVCEHEYSYALRDRFGANPFDPFDTMEDIALAKQNADKVIVMYHGGKEQCEYPSPRLRKACRAMVRAGADVVLTQHSHCIGCRETYKGGQIVYGEGNFNFVKYSDNPQWESGLMIVADIDKDVKLEFVPVVVNDNGIELAKGDRKTEILEGFNARSELIKDEDAWLKAWNDWCTDSARAYYVAAPAKAFAEIPEGEKCGQVFPHYLDCEAHLDVWKTLFLTWHADKTSGA